MSKEFTEPVMISTSQGMHIDSKEIAEKIAKKKLSASMITGLEGCAARWVADTFVIRELLPEEPDNAARRGSLFHKVMEDFFALPKEERTKENLNIVTNKILNDDEFKDLAAIPDAMNWLKTAIKNYYDMKARPQMVDVATIKNDWGKEIPGLEVFIQGNIGETERDILGFIDIVVKDAKNPDKIIVRDWKSGAKAKKWNPNTKSTDGLGEARQQVIYTMLLEDKGYEVSGAQLIFPVAKEIVNVDIKDEDFRKRVVKDVQETEKKLNHMIERNVFEYKPDFLCAWCSLSKICNAATIKPYQKMQDAYASQPSPEILMKAIDVQ